MKVKNIATVYAILAAALYAINVPMSKMLLKHVEPTMMASFLYLGAGVGLFLYGLLEKATGKIVKIVATSMIALVLFKEVISKRLWIAITLVTTASIILSFEGIGSFEFNYGSLFVLGACLCWGFENNCTRMISNKSSVEIVIIKGIFSGLLFHSPVLRGGLWLASAWRKTADSVLCCTDDYVDQYMVYGQGYD